MVNPTATALYDEIHSLLDTNMLWEVRISADCKKIRIAMTGITSTDIETLESDLKLALQKITHSTNYFMLDFEVE